MISSRNSPSSATKFRESSFAAAAHTMPGWPPVPPINPATGPRPWHHVVHNTYKRAKGHCKARPTEDVTNTQNPSQIRNSPNARRILVSLRATKGSAKRRGHTNSDRARGARFTNNRAASRGDIGSSSLLWSHGRKGRVPERHGQVTGGGGACVRPRAPGVLGIGGFTNLVPCRPELRRH